MSSSHLFRTSTISPQTIRSGGFRTDITADQLPVLTGLSLSILELQAKAFREPHWHPNANELSYCISGKGFMTIFGPGNNHDSFTIDPGEIVFVPKGFMHHIENIGNEPLKMLICFNHERPEDLDLSMGIKVMPDHILGATFSLQANFFDKLQTTKESFIAKNSSSILSLPKINNRYKFNLEAAIPPIQTDGGWVKLSNDFFLPTLNELAVYSLMLNPKGAREPHWHPNAGELNYLVKGSARITLLSPKGKSDTFDMKPGDLSFMPKGYLHHIENTGDDDAQYIIFFDNKEPSDVGFSGCLGAYSNNILASLFDVPIEYLDKLPKYQSDLFIVGGG